jgi:ATP-binding cassette subfamily B protein
MKKTVSNRRVLKRVLHELKGSRLLLLLSLLFAAGSVAVTLAVPLLTGNAIDHIIEKGNVDFDGVVKVAVQIGILALASALCQWLMSVIHNRITYGMVRKLRRDAFAKIQKLPISYLDSHAVGDIVSRMMTDID